VSRSPGFLSADTPKPKRVAMSVLGQDAISPKTSKPKRIPRAELARGAELARHATCVDHVPLAGGVSENRSAFARATIARRCWRRRASWREAEVIDPILEAYEEYERNVAPAYEVIRRARARLAERTAAAADDTIPAYGAWLRRAVPDEPNGAEFAVEASIDSADQDVRSGASTAEPEPGDSPPVASAPAIQQPGQGARTTGPVVRVGTPAPASRSTAGRAVDPAKGWVRCPECGERVRAQGLGAHRGRSKAHAAVVDSAAGAAIATVIRPLAVGERNPRTTPPLELPPRLDRVSGE
jgi:hypothetical protein